MAADGTSRLRAYIRQYIRLMMLYARMDYEWFVQDLGTCICTLLSETVANLSGALGLYLLAARFNGLSMLNQNEVLFMLGFYTMTTGMFGLFFTGFNSGLLSRRIGRGQVDHMLIMPIPLPLQLLTESFIPFSGSATFLAGIAITAVAVSKLSLRVDIGFIALTLLFLVSAMFIMLGMSYIVASSAFYHPAGSEEISSVMIESLGAIAPYPLSGLGSVMQTLLCTVFPSGMLAWLPSMLLLGKLSLPLCELAPPLLALLLCSLATVLLKKGMNVYAKRGSQRYSDLGHRC